MSDKPASSEEGRAPATLPRELKDNVTPGAGVSVADSASGAPLTIEEIVNSPVVSASNRRESAQAAPAWVLVFTQKDLRDRGYTDLSQLLDDLPGMDVARSFGDSYVRGHWRGYRAEEADPYLLMVDGLTLNSLFFRDIQTIATLALSSIDHVEVVYGPASATYGPNAAMGVINVITSDGARRDPKEFGGGVASRVTYGGPQANWRSVTDATKIVDATASYSTRDFRLRVATRIEDGALDQSIADRSEYTRGRYLGDARRWGAPVLASLGSYGGRFFSPDRKRSVDARFQMGDTELSARYFELETGLGTRYPADRYQNGSESRIRDLLVGGKHTAQLAPSVLSSTLALFRQSDVEANGLLVKPELRGPNLYAGDARNSAVMVQQDLSVDVGRNLFMEGDQLSAAGGVKYMHLRLARDYTYTTDIYYDLSEPEDRLLATPNAADSSAHSRDIRTRVPANEMGIYLNGRYQFPKANALHFGVRADSQRLTDNVDVTLRGGYVGTFERLTIKALYGQASYAPGQYERTYAVGQLDEERMHSLEGNATYTFPFLALSGAGWFVDYSKPIIDYANRETRQMSGMDLGARLLVRPFSVWAYYSRLFHAKQSATRPGDAPDMVVDTPDVSTNKVWSGATFEKGSFTATLLGRFMGERNVPQTNPLGPVPGYFVMDFNTTIRNVFVSSMWASFRVTNIFGVRYEHPGTVSAGAGNTPGFTDPTGGWIGSRDIYASRLPQPGRGFYLTLGVDM